MLTGIGTLGVALGAAYAAVAWRAQNKEKRISDLAIQCAAASSELRTKFLDNFTLANSMLPNWAGTPSSISYRDLLRIQLLATDADDYVKHTQARIRLLRESAHQLIIITQNSTLELLISFANLCDNQMVRRAQVQNNCKAVLSGLGVQDIVPIDDTLRALIDDTVFDLQKQFTNTTSKANAIADPIISKLITV
jgi:hypothetical protein